jgi:hypothetical protein
MKMFDLSVLPRLPLPGSLALGAQHGKLDADLRTYVVLGTPSVQPVHDYYSICYGGWGPVGAYGG